VCIAVKLLVEKLLGAVSVGFFGCCVVSSGISPGQIDEALPLLLSRLDGDLLGFVRLLLDMLSLLCCCLCC
jgi:hypothetical protein